MGCCCRKPQETEEGDQKEDSVVHKQVTPSDDRRCTDILWLGLFVVGWVIYIIVTIIGFSDGQPAKLFKPRDFQGAYCGTEVNWNSGPNLMGMDKQSYTMNVSAVVDQVAKQVLCSDATSSLLLSDMSPLANQQEKDDYAIACCLRPSKSCTGSLALGKGGNVGDPAALKAMITERMKELTDVSSSDFFNPAGANGDFASKMWEEATKYFFPVCLSSCDPEVDSDFRAYNYTPLADSPLRTAWTKLQESKDPALASITSTINNDFQFKALPESVCKYKPVYCVPMPGVKFSKLAGDYCSFKMTDDVTKQIGDAAAETFVSLGGNAFSNMTSETLGTWAGAFEQSLDSFVVVSLLGFVISIIFIVLLRFCVGPCVWLALILVFMMLMVGGGIVFVRSGQCADAGLFDTGRQVAVAVTVSSANAVSNAVTGTEGPSEDLKGDNGREYVGVQYRSISGFLCKDWKDAPAEYRVLLTENDRNNNFCRNPYNDDSAFIAETIWCFTTDTEKPWEICYPLGVLQPECKNGYAVEGQTARDFMVAGAVVLWCLALLWLIIIGCCFSRIKLAIGLNQVAAKFLGHTPLIVLVPIVQGIVGVAWALLWAFSACFLLSQVPDGWTPTGSFASYAEAYGTADTPGKCTDKWPTGFVWRDELCSEEDTPECWKCAPPRYIFDARFFISFFIFLWNNAFIIALGQTCIAGAAGVWFFTPNNKKGKVHSIWNSVVNVFRFHVGSLAFGAFILAVVQLIRYLMMYFEQQAKAQKNRIVACILKVMQYCIWCLERFIRFLNKNAYIQVALRGTPFCTSAKKAWEIITQNMLRFGVVAVLGRVIHAIGFLFIMSCTTIAGYFVLKAMHPDLNPVIPLLMYFTVSYVIGKLYMSVYGLTVDTCLQCVIAAEEMTHDGNFVPESLRSVLPAKVAWDGKGDGDKNNA